MAEMKTFNGYEVVDAKARQDIAELKEKEPDLSNYYTKAQTDSAIGEAVNSIEIPEVDLTPYAKVADMPTKVSELENDSGYLTEHQSLDGLATEQYVDNAIADIPEVDLSSYYTKAEVDNKYAKVSDSYYLDFSAGMLNSYQDATEAMIKFAEHLQAENTTKDKDACAYIKDTHDNIYYPAIISYGWTNGKFRIILTKTGVNLNNIAAQSETYWDTCEIITGDDGKWKYNILGTGCFTFASKEYVDDTIAALEARIAALEGNN